MAYVVPAIDDSALDQVFSRKRPRSRIGPPLGPPIAGRASSLPTLHVTAKTACCRRLPAEGADFVIFVIKSSKTSAVSTTV